MNCPSARSSRASCPRKTTNRDPESFDFHLWPDAPAIDHGHATDHPATDIDGERRPNGGASDAGADEHW